MSSAIYVYAIASRESRPPVGASGFGSAPLLVLPWHALAAVTSTVTPGEFRATRENVLRHEAVVEAIRREGPALPVRFGTVFRDRDSLEQALDERYEVLAADMKRVGDKVELGVSVLWDERSMVDEELRAEQDGTPSALDSAGAQGPGGRYMRARLAEHRREVALRNRAGSLARQLDDVLSAHALASRHTILPTARLAVRAAYLLEPSQFGTFRALVADMQRAHPGIRFLLSGPWPPYSFVTAAEPDVHAVLRGQIQQVVGSLYRAQASRDDREMAG
jgi:hypothetical protein